MSKTAAVSSRQELYPRGMAAERALRLGIGALSGLGLGEAEDGFTIGADAGTGTRAVIPRPSHCRIVLNFDDMLKRVGLEVTWDPETTKYHIDPK